MRLEKLVQAVYWLIHLYANLFDHDQFFFTPQPGNKVSYHLTIGLVQKVYVISISSC